MHDASVRGMEVPRQADVDKTTRALNEEVQPTMLLPFTHPPEL